MFRAKDIKKVQSSSERGKHHDQEALALVVSTASSVDETIELHMSLSTRDADSSSRLSFFCFGTGKNVRVLVIAKGDRANEAKKQALTCWRQDMIDKIQRKLV